MFSMRIVVDASAEQNVWIMYELTCRLMRKVVRKNPRNHRFFFSLATQKERKKKITAQQSFQNEITITI